MKIVLLSHTNRSNIFKVGSYHLSRELLKLGHSVLYISTPISFLHLIKGMVSRSYWRTELVKRLRLTLGKYSRIPNTSNPIVDYVPFTLFPYINLPLLDLRINGLYFTSITIPSVRSVLKKYKFTRVDIVLLDFPNLAFMKRFIDSGKWVYRITDNYSEFSNMPKSIIEVEDYINTFVDKIIVTSEPSAEMVRKRWNKEALLLENGVDLSLLKTDIIVPYEYRKSDSIKVVYVGSFDDERFDWVLLKNVAEICDSYEFYLIGPNFRSKIGIPSNVFILGSRDYSLLPSYYKNSDVGILPFKSGGANDGRSPVKLYEYGIFGLPIVAIKTQELSKRNHPFVLLSDDSISFARQLNDAIKRKSDLTKSARNISMNYSWRNIAKSLLDYCMQ